MIGNISKGRGFRGCLSYLLDKEKAELIGGNMLGQTARELAAEFKLSRSLNPNIKQPVFHASLSLPKREDHAEHLDDERWNQLAADYLQQMGFTRNQYVVVRHFDRDHDHVHIVAARVRLDGTIVDDSWDYRTSQEIIRQLEQEYNLMPVLSSWEVQRRGQTKGQYEQHRREDTADITPTPSVKLRIADIADRILQDCDTPEQFIQKMQEAGVQIQTRLRRDGSISGISYQYKVNGTNVATPGNKLGMDYSWSGIVRRIQELEQRRTQATPEAGYLEQESLGATNLERAINPQQLTLWQFSDTELLEASKAVADYFATQPPQPPSLNEQLVVKLEINRLIDQNNRLWQQQSEQVKLAESMQKNPFRAWSKKYDALVKQLEHTMEAISQSLAQKDQKETQLQKWDKQSKAYQEWEVRPQTQQMRQLAAFLNQPHVQSRLLALKQEWKQRQWEGRETAIAVQELFRLTGIKRQPDGCLMFDGASWRLKQLGNTVSVSVKQDNREILRVEGDKTVVFNPTPEEREKMYSFRKQVNSDLQKEQQQLQAERKQSQLSR